MTIELIIKIIETQLNEIIENEKSDNEYLQGLEDGREIAYQRVLEMLEKLEINEIGQEDVMGEGFPW